MFTPAQLRAARGLLDWTRASLAKASGLSKETIKNIEHGIYKPQDSTIDAIVRTFAAYDVEFTENEGVRRRREKITKFEGHNGFRKFMDEVYAAARDPSAALGGNKPICVSNVDDRLFVEHLGDYSKVHVQRMNALKNVKVRVIVNEQNFYAIPNGKYLEYRYSPKQGISSVPFYVYGDKFALILFNEDPSPQIIVISSELASKAYREQFDILWQISHKAGNNINI